jgi:hypothetical protein
MGFFSFLRKGGKNNGHKNGNRIDNSSIDNQAISSLLKSYIRLDDSLGLKSTGRCGILVKNMNT